MKKVLTMLACVGAIMAMNAQTPQEQAKTYYNNGKQAIKKYDEMLGLLKIGMLKNEDLVPMAQSLIDAYDNFILVLPLDSLPDAKGKVKPKYTKNIKNELAGHYKDFMDAGKLFYDANDYKNAIRAWDTFVELSENPGRFDIEALPDSTVASYIWNQGIAANAIDDYTLASNKMMEAAKKGYSKEIVYQYGLQLGQQANNSEAILYFGTEGDKLFGTNDSRYINSLINFYLKTEEYDAAIKYLDEAIAKNPQGSQYYALEGIIYESKKDMPKAMELYKKAVDLDSTNGLANYYYGRGLSIEAGQMADDFKGNEAEFQEFYKAELLPRYNEAIAVLEKAYEQDPNTRSSNLNMLEQLYYVTNNEEGMNSVKERRLAD